MTLYVFTDEDKWEQVQSGRQMPPPRGWYQVIEDDFGELKRVSVVDIYEDSIDSDDTLMLVYGKSAYRVLEQKFASILVVPRAYAFDAEIGAWRGVL
jgi:hypothetical protein